MFQKVTSGEEFEECSGRLFGPLPETVGQCGTGQQSQAPAEQARPRFETDQDVGVEAERVRHRLLGQLELCDCGI